MENIVPFKTENTYLATEFLMKDPYKNTRIVSLLEHYPDYSMIIYDNGVIKGILSVDPVHDEMWFYGNSKSLKAVIGNIEIKSNQVLYIDKKNLDIIQSRFSAEYSGLLVMRLKIREYEGTTVADGVESDTGNPGEEDRHANIFIKRKNGEIMGSVKVLSLNIKSCAIGCVHYRDGEEESLYGIISSIVNIYKSQTENIVIYAPYQEKLKDGLLKLGFINSGELLKLYNIVPHRGR